MDFSAIFCRGFHRFSISFLTGPHVTQGPRVQLQAASIKRPSGSYQLLWICRSPGSDAGCPNAATNAQMISGGRTCASETDDKVNTSSQFATAAKGIARHGSDDGLAHTHDLVGLWGERSPAKDVDKLLSRIMGNIARRQRPFRAGDHDAAGLFRFLSRFNASATLFNQRWSFNAFPLLRTVQRDKRDVVSTSP